MQQTLIHYIGALFNQITGIFIQDLGTDYVDNTVGVVLDPLAIHNYALDDDNSELSEEEFNKLQIAYTFAS